MAAATILMVDDNPVNLVVLRALLGRAGYELIAADSGQAALDLVRANPKFDLILLDVSMPGRNGISVCRDLKSDPATAHIPVVLVSGVRTDEDSVREGRQAGADGYLTKPIEDTAVRAWVKVALELDKVFRETAAEAEGARGKAREVRQTLCELPSAVKGLLEAIYVDAEILASDLPEGSKGKERADEIKAHVLDVARQVAEASLLAGEAFPGRRGPSEPE
ncbi:MAG: response regulator [Candidatus Hydrogenedentes bacterium]|nr:response regulator [Candidatus Hydrogenedentota bacterium]